MKFKGRTEGFYRFLFETVNVVKLIYHSAKYLEIQYSISIRHTRYIFRISYYNLYML
jgi:hypothetical protein